jgi:hypothetical protein
MVQFDVEYLLVDADRMTGAVSTSQDMFLLPKSEIKLSWHSAT